MKNKDIDIDWKDKAIKRSRFIKELKKRIKVIIKARNKWKTKYLIERKKSLQYQKEIESIKKKVVNIIQI